jgi:hypothetical protein
LASDHLDFRDFIIISLLDNPSIIFFNSFSAILFIGLVFIILSICSSENLGNFITLVSSSNKTFTNSFALNFHQLIALSVIHSVAFTNFFALNIQFKLVFIVGISILNLFSSKLFEIPSDHFTFLN